MKLVYRAGLEHSGSTLAAHLLGGHPSSISLGEIAPFFSPGHMSAYMRKWGDYADATLCSCGKHWKECDFWAGLQELSGLYSDKPLTEKYKALFGHVRAAFGRDAVIVDSSKSLPVLNTLSQDPSEMGLVPEDIFMALTVKDVRSFAASMIRKKPTGGTKLLAVLRSFNLWLFQNRQFVDYLDSHASMQHCVSLYEKLCQDTDGIINGLLERIGLNALSNVDVSHNRSHIAMGNKNFTVRNKGRVSYDDAWYNDDAINLVYLLHRKARNLNKQIYGMSQARCKSAP